MTKKSFRGHNVLQTYLVFSCLNDKKEHDLTATECSYLIQQTGDFLDAWDCHMVEFSLVFDSKYAKQT